jgi:hypothetical protein
MSRAIAVRREPMISYNRRDDSGRESTAAASFLVFHHPRGFRPTGEVNVSMNSDFKDLLKLFNNDIRLPTLPVSIKMAAS